MLLVPELGKSLNGVGGWADDNWLQILLCINMVREIRMQDMHSMT